MMTFDQLATYHSRLTRLDRRMDAAQEMRDAYALDGSRGTAANFARSMLHLRRVRRRYVRRFGSR